MKKFFIVVMALVFCAGGIFTVEKVSAQEKVIQIISMNGTIESISDTQVTIKKAQTSEIVVANLNAETYILNGADGNKLSKENLAINMNITVYAPNRMASSMPPQISAIAIIIGDNTPKTARYIKAADVKAVDGAVKVTDVNNTIIVTVTKDVIPYPTQIKSGDELLVWYSKMTMSMPGQTTAEKAMVIRHERADIIAHLGAGVISAGGREINTAPVKKADTVMLPLRSVAEALGHDVTWKDGSILVQARGGNMSYTLNIGNVNYGKARMNVELAYAPEIIGGATYVPMEFFSVLMNKSVDVIDTHI